MLSSGFVTTRQQVIPPSAAGSGSTSIWGVTVTQERGSGTLQPTFTGHVATTNDAPVLFEACISGHLNRVPRRPHDRERARDACKREITASPICGGSQIFQTRFWESPPPTVNDAEFRGSPLHHSPRDVSAGFGLGRSVAITITPSYGRFLG